MIAKARKNGLRLSKHPSTPPPATFAILNGKPAVKQAVIKTDEHLGAEHRTEQLKHAKRESPTSVQFNIVPPSGSASSTQDVPPTLPSVSPTAMNFQPSTSSRPENDLGSNALNLQGSATSTFSTPAPHLTRPAIVPADDLDDTQTAGSSSSTSSAKSKRSQAPSPPPDEPNHEALLGSDTTSVPSQYHALHSALQSDWFTQYLNARIRDLQPLSNDHSVTVPSHPVQLNTSANWPKTYGIYMNPLTWDLDLYFGKYECLFKQRDRERRLRGVLDGNSDWRQKASMAHKVLDASFVHLTKNHESHQAIMKQAAKFLSAFHEEGAIWAINTADLSPAERQAVDWWHSHFHDARPATRFVRFRFPDVRFEFSFDAFGSRIGLLARSSQKQSIPIEYEWTAFSRLGTNVVAHGNGRDHLTVTAEGYLVIVSRELGIRKIPLPELMHRVPYPEAGIRSPAGPSIARAAVLDEEKLFVNAIFRLAGEWAIPCVALGASLVSAQHVIAVNFGVVVGWAAALVGFFVATFPLFTLLFANG